MNIELKMSHLGFWIQLAQIWHLALIQGFQYKKQDSYCQKANFHEFW